MHILVNILRKSLCYYRKDKEGEEKEEGEEKRGKGLHTLHSDVHCFDIYE